MVAPHLPTRRNGGKKPEKRLASQYRREAPILKFEMSGCARDILETGNFGGGVQKPRGDFGYLVELGGRAASEGCDLGAQSILLIKAFIKENCAEIQLKRVQKPG